MLTQHHLGVLERQLLKYLLHPFTQFIQNAFIAYNCPQYGHIVCNLNRHKKSPLSVVDIFVPKRLMKTLFQHIKVLSS